MSKLTPGHVEVPDQVVTVGQDAMVKVIDIDLERRRISLSLKQADEDYTEEFDPSKYGMADSYDEQGNYIFPEGFDPETNEWLEGFEAQRANWEQQYADAQARWEAHKEQVRKALAEDADAAATAAAGSSSSTSSASSSAPAPASYSSEAAADSGTLASDEALAALREKLTGNN